MPAPRDEDAPVTNPEAEERVQFMLRLRARGIGDLRLLRALERAPRALFMPQRYGDIAARDIALPIGCGQTAPPPSIVAAMIEALDPGAGSRVLEIGTGTGYAAALLAQLAGEVVSLERCQTLALEASARLEAFGLANVRVVWADGLALDPEGGLYDRILVHALIEAPAPRLTEAARRRRLARRGGRRRRLGRAAHRPFDARGERRNRRRCARRGARPQALGRGTLARLVRRRAEPRGACAAPSHTKDSS